MIRIEPARGVDVGVADHELLEDVVLDRAGELLGRHALLLGGHDVEGEDRQHRAVHRHRHRHLVERDAGEQRAHVVDRIDRDPGHADIARDAGVVGIVAPVGGEVEGHRQALLPGREVAPVERVRILRRGEAGILPDGPGLGHVHGRIGPAQERRHTRIGVEELDAVAVLGPIDPLHRNALGRHPGFAHGRHRGRDGIGRVGNGREVGDARRHGLWLVRRRQACIIGMRRVRATPNRTCPGRGRQNRHFPARTGQIFSDPTQRNFCVPATPPPSASAKGPAPRRPRP